MVRIFVFLISIFLVTNSHAEPKVKVLAILPLSGEIAALGNSGKNGMLMALEKSPDIDLQFEDDSGSPKNTVSALQKHLSTSRPTIVIAASSGTSKAISPILEKEQIPLIAIATDEEVSKGKKYVVNFWVTPDEEAELLIKGVRLGGGIKTLRSFLPFTRERCRLKENFQRQIKEN